MRRRSAGSRVADGRITAARPSSANTDTPVRALAAETALYAPTKRFLEGRGYTVKGEVCGCDVVAMRPGAPEAVAVVELKLGLTLDLVLQGVDRMALADAVWLAVAATAHGRIRDKRAVRLCRLLGFGLLAVDAGRGRVEVLAEPTPYRPRKSPRRRERVVREHRERSGDPMAGGGTGMPVMTAYRQRALACAALLRDGPRPVPDLAATVPDAGRMLLRNVYGWFARERRGTYCLTEPGQLALAAWNRPRARLQPGRRGCGLTRGSQQPRATAPTWAAAVGRCQAACCRKHSAAAHVRV